MQMNDNGTGHCMKRKKGKEFFLIAFICGFACYVIPGYLFSMLSSLSWICWIFPNPSSPGSSAPASQALALLLSGSTGSVSPLTSAALWPGCGSPPPILQPALCLSCMCSPHSITGTICTEPRPSPSPRSSSLPREVSTTFPASLTPTSI